MNAQIADERHRGAGFLTGADDPAFKDLSIQRLMAERGHLLPEESIERLQRVHRRNARFHGVRNFHLKTENFAHQQIVRRSYWIQAAKNQLQFS